MKQRMQNSYGKGVAIRSAPSSCAVTARDSVKRRQGYRRGGLLSCELAEQDGSDPIVEAKLTSGILRITTKEQDSQDTGRD
jgi:hypothetical protein